MIIGQEVANINPYIINNIAPIELINRSLTIFFIKKETISTADAAYPIHSVVEMSNIFIKILFWQI